MKVSYKVLKKYIPDIDSPEKIAQDLIMHCAEVEWVHAEGDDFLHMVYGVIESIEKHPDADTLKVCMVDIWESELSQIVCGGSNLSVWQWVAVAKVGASVLWHGVWDPVVMKKTKIRGVESHGMICAAEEIGLGDIFPQKTETEIVDLTSYKAKPGMSLAELLSKDDVILEIDNKAINHRPDLFSHIGIARELAAIGKKDFSYEMLPFDSSSLPDAGIKNEITEVVQRYIGVYVTWVKNIPSPRYILDVLSSHSIASKWLLVDISNYSLYLYWQPTHIFDAEKLKGTITVRYALEEESFLWLNDKNYTLTSEDIVIADDSWVLALWGIIGGKYSAVSENTKNIVIESAHFDQAVLRKTGKRLGIRTDALNVFEKNISLHMQSYALSVIISELQKYFPEMQLVSATDTVITLPERVTIPYNPSFLSRLIWKDYSREEIWDIFRRLGIKVDGDICSIPFWRTDLTTQADLAEEVARISGYHHIEPSIPRIELGAISQYPLYNAKRDIRNFLTSRGYFEMYTYSFVNEMLLQKCYMTLEESVPLKNTLSEEMTHMRPSLIPNLLQALSDNAREYQNIQLFECEKVFLVQDGIVREHYELSVLVSSESKNILYYDIVSELDDIFAKLQISWYRIDTPQIVPSYAQNGRTGSIIVHGKVIGHIGEIHPQVIKNFDVKGRVAYISLDIEKLIPACYSLIQAREISNFQANRFDLNFVVAKGISWKKIQETIQKTDILIQKVELFDIYESEEKLPWERSLSFTLTIQSMSETLSDSVKNKLISDITARVEKVGGRLR